MNDSIENEAVTPMTAERIISMIHPDIPPATAHFLLNEAKPLLVELEQLRADAERWRYAMDWNNTEFAVCMRDGMSWTPIKTNGPIDAAITKEPT